MRLCACGSKLGRKKKTCYRCDYRNKGRSKFEIKRDIVRAYKCRPCTDCGVRYEPHIMDFDHVIGEKKFSVSSSILHRKLEDILEEIAKCEVVCSNCHRDRTYRRLNGKKRVLMF